MKNFSRFICFFAILFFMTVSVKADYDCYYSAKYPATWSGGSPKEEEASFTVLEDEKQFKTRGFFDGTAPIIMDPYIEIDNEGNTWTEESLIDFLAGSCPSSVYVCRAKSFGDTSYDYMILINATLKDNFYKLYDTVYERYSINAHMFLEEDCVVGNIIEDKATVPIMQFDFSCDKYDELYKQLKSNYCNIGDENCDTTKINAYNNYKDQLKSYCNSKLEYADYIDSCVQNCLNLSERIEEIEGKSYVNGDCGFSQRLLVWLSNILRWAKYIVPVIVIIFGILDFIKAVGADKDDEMKKAQGRFVKRLIAVALIFIVPLILEFVLDKMGFGYDTCGLF